MKRVVSLVSVLRPSVRAEVVNLQTGKIILSGPAGMLLELDKIPNEWTAVDTIVKCGGEFGTVQYVIDKENK